MNVPLTFYLNAINAMILLMDQREEWFIKRIEAKRAGHFIDADYYEKKYNSLGRALEKIIDAVCQDLKTRRNK